MAKKPGWRRAGNIGKDSNEVVAASYLVKYDNLQASSPGGKMSESLPGAKGGIKRNLCLQWGCPWYELGKDLRVREQKRLGAVVRAPKKSCWGGFIFGKGGPTAEGTNLGFFCRNGSEKGGRSKGKS